VIDLAKLPDRTRQFVERGAPEGQRANEAFAAAVQLRDGGATENEAIQLVESGAAKCGLPLPEARGAVKSAFSRSPREPIHRGNGKNHGAGKKIVATYDYADQTGKLLFQCVRYSPKDFRQRQPDGRDGFLWNLKGVELVLYRLPEVVKASDVWVVEGEKDVDSLAALGFSATCNPLGAGKWRSEYTESLRGKSVVVIADKDVAGREHAEKVARSLHSAGVHCKVLELPGEGVKDASDFVATFNDYADAAERLAIMAETAPEWTPTPTRQPAPDAMQSVVNDPRPKIRLPGDNWLMSSTATELGQALCEQDIFLRNGEVCILKDSELHPVDAQTFRTWIENHCVMYRQKTFNESVYEVDVTLRDDESRGILASPQFTGELRVVRRVNHARLPILRADGTIELLPEGYDPTSKTLTDSNVTYAENVSLEKAVETVNDLLSEFDFADAGRSKAVAVAMMLTLYASQVIPEGSLRPCFIVTKNAEGAGATTLVLCAVVPVLGAMPCGVKTDEDSETRKALTAVVREARTVIVLDNQKSRLSSAALEAFISSPHWSDRILGENTTFTGPNLATVFATANGCTVSPDMRRRSLFAELHLEAERAEDREFKRSLDLPTLLQMRPQILAALWAIVRHWDAKGRPAPSRSHSAFPSWAKSVGGAVEAAGFGCCLESPKVTAAVDPDADDMRGLVAAMSESAKSLTFSELVDLARQHGCFETIIGTEGELKHVERSRMAKLLARYDCRLVGDHRFVIAGKGHGRKFRVDRVTTTHGRTVEHGVSAERGNPHIRELDQKTMLDRATVQVELAERDNSPP